jgi:hypothetical protein
MFCIFNRSIISLNLQTLIAVNCVRSPCITAGLDYLVAIDYEYLSKRLA